METTGTTRETQHVNLHVDVWGTTGSRVVLVHGSMTNAATWRTQRALADRWQLVIPARRGFAPNPPNPPGVGANFEVDAEDVAPLLEDGAHLVGHSYGGLVAMLVAAARPEAVRSLVLLEPAAHALVKHEPEFEAIMAEHRKIRASITDPREFLVAFTHWVGNGREAPDPLPPHVLQHVLQLMNERPPHDATLPLAELAALAVPKLVLSGSDTPLQDKVFEQLAAEIGAPHEVVAGAGHNVHYDPEVNDRLEAFWASSEAGAERG